MRRNIELNKHLAADPSRKNPTGVISGWKSILNTPADGRGETRHPVRYQPDHQWRDMRISHSGADLSGNRVGGHSGIGAVLHPLMTGFKQDSNSAIG